MEYIKFIGILAFTWLFVEGAAPAQFIKKLLKVHNESTPKDIYRQIIRELVNCCECSGFWIGLIYYYSHSESYILLACLTSIGAGLFARILKFLNFKIFNQL